MQIPCARRRIIAQFEPILPIPTVRWTDFTSDRVMSLVAFQGLGAHRSEPLDGEPGGAAYAASQAHRSTQRQSAARGKV
jgi:hypothetical protein